MAYESAIAKQWTDGSLTLSDGTGSPVTLVVDLEVGDMSVSGVSESHKTVNPYYSRGSLVSLRKGQDAHPAISFSTLMGGLSDAVLTTVSDFIFRRNSYSGNISTSTALGDAYTVDMELTIEGTDFGDAADHVVTVTDVHATRDLSEGEPNTLAFSGTVYGTVTET
jgi:hypothetical protein|tara:strand:+ start:7498 stop:7995 length:498 start_codon:yes stop_codon:yes gene_type:complete